MTPNLAELDQKVFDYTRDMITECGSAPTLREISDLFGLFSVSAARIVVDRLVAADLLVRTGGRERNLALPPTPDVDLLLISTGSLQEELKRRSKPFYVPRRQPTRFTRPCGKDGCSERVTRGKLLCRDHWFLLPEGLRNELHIYNRTGNVAAYQDAWRRATDMLERAHA